MGKEGTVSVSLAPSQKDKRPGPGPAGRSQEAKVQANQAKVDVLYSTLIFAANAKTVFSRFSFIFDRTVAIFRGRDV